MTTFADRVYGEVMPTNPQVGYVKPGTEVSARGRFPRTTYTVTLPGHYEQDDNGALQLVDGGTHTATGYGKDWVRSQCKKAGVTPIWGAATRV